MRTLRKWISGLAAVAVLVAALPGVSAAGELTRYLLADGDWIGVSTASGAFRADAEGVEVVWIGTVGGVYQFTVAGDDLSGSWDFFGGAVQLVRGGSPPAEAEGNLEYAGGGPLSGSAELIVMGGQVTTTGEVELRAEGADVEFPVDVTSPIGNLEMPVFEICDEAYGEWDVVVADAFGDAGFQSAPGFGDLEGVFVAFQDKEGFSEIAAGILKDGGYDVPERFQTEFADLPEILGLVRAIQNDVAELFGEFPDWSYDEVAFTIDQANAALNQLRSLNECERRFVGEDNVERWINVLQLMVHKLVAGLAELNLFPGSDDIDIGSFRGAQPPALASQAWQLLTVLALRSGAIGPGAFDQDAAQATEDALRSSGADILRANTAIDGSLADTDDVTRVLATGAALGWVFDVDGTAVDAAEAFTELASG